MGLEEVDQERVLARLVDEHHLLADLLHRRSLGGDLDLDRVDHQLRRERGDRRGHGGGEEHRLAALGQLGDDPPDVGQEAHVEHAVGLVEDEQLHLVEVDDALRHQVDEPPRAGDDSLGALLEVLHLPVLAYAADEARGRQPRPRRVAAGVLRRLHRELPRRREDERARMADAARLAHLDQALEDRQHKRRGLAGASLGDADQVAAVEQQRNRLLLNGRRGRIAGVRHRVLQLLVKPAENIAFKHWLMARAAGFEPATN